MDLLLTIAEKRASDLHIVAGLPPMMRINTIIKPLGVDLISAEDAKNLVYSIICQRVY